MLFNAVGDYVPGLRKGPGGRGKLFYGLSTS